MNFIHSLIRKQHDYQNLQLVLTNTEGDIVREARFEHQREREYKEYELHKVI